MTALPPFAIDARTILESMGDAFYAVDRDWRVVYANQRALAFWGMLPADIVGRSLWDALPRLVGTANETMLRRARQEGRPISFEAPSPVTGAWVQVTIAPYDGGLAIYWRDITARKNAELALRDNEEHLRLAQESAGIGTWDWDLQCNRIHWSSQMFRLLDREPTEAPDGDLYALWLQALHPDDRASADARARAHSSNGAPFSQEFRIVRRNGETRWIASIGNVLADETGAPRRMLGINIDITDRKRAEAALERHVQERTRELRATLVALQESRTRYSAIFEHAPVDLMFLRVLPDGRLLVEDVNPSWSRSSGFGRDAVVGRVLDDIFPPEQAAFVQAQFRRAVKTGKPVEYEYSTKFPTGDVVRRAFQVPLYGPDGSVQHVLLTAVDLTEMRMIEAQLHQAQKMEAIGQLTGGIAHDFNNLLTAITGNLELLQRRSSDERALRFIDTALNAARRGGTLTQQLLAYARRQHLTPQALDANRVLRDMSELLHRTLGGLVQVTMRTQADLWLAQADPAQLESMILNLAINARDAMPEGGSLHIATRNLAGAPAGSAPELEYGDYVVIAVTDDGPGMPPEVQQRAFEPFFTTKEIGKGSGLGLAQVFGLARQFGGTARLRSAPGQGTTVEIFLPRARTPQPADAEEPADSATLHGSAVALVVDDEADVRAVAADFLREAGYRVHEAADSETALAILRAQPVSLALVDYAMPGSSGIELVRLARCHRPELKVVYVSGNASLLDPDTQEGDAVVAKPYTASTLLRAVRDALAGPPAR